MAQKRRHKDLIETYASLPDGQSGGQLRLLQYDDFPLVLPQKLRQLGN